MAEKQEKSTKFRVLSPNKDVSASFNEDGLRDIQIKPPTHLNDDAANLWRAIIPDIKQMGYLKKIDQPVLELYCMYYGMYLESERLIAEDGMWVEDKYGTRAKRSPGAIQIDACVKNLSQLGNALGLTFDSGMRQITVGEPEGAKKPQPKTPLQGVKFGADV